MFSPNVRLNFSFVRVVPLPDYSHARIGNQRGGDCDHVGRHSGGVHRDASTRRHAGRQNWQFQGQLLSFSTSYSCIQQILSNTLLIFKMMNENVLMLK